MHPCPHCDSLAEVVFASDGLHHPMCSEAACWVGPGCKITHDKAVIAWNRMIDGPDNAGFLSLALCSCCDNAPVVMSNHYGNHRVCCTGESCGCTGPSSGNREEAIAAWNRVMRYAATGRANPKRTKITPLDASMIIARLAAISDECGKAADDALECGQEYALAKIHHIDRRVMRLHAEITEAYGTANAQEEELP